MNESYEPEHQYDDTLVLPKTGLRIGNGELQRRSKNGGVTMRLPLNTIEDAEFRTGFDPACLIIALVGGGLGAVAYFVSENNILTSLLYAAGVVLLGLSLLAARYTRIVIKARGEVIHIQCIDLVDEGEGFVLSLRQHLPN
ncbi:MAG TPA: hypothetical protein VKE98_19660 [Gemmataceae bacterium]|nr:hypothetical protein [Gemmataceae bacterium]